MFVLFCDPLKTLASIKAFSLKVYTINSAFKFELEIKNQIANSLELLLLNGFYQDSKFTTFRKFLKHLKKSISLWFINCVFYSIRSKLLKLIT